jgi:hypothetical protein
VAALPVLMRAQYACNLRFRLAETTTLQSHRRSSEPRRRNFSKISSTLKFVVL